MTNTQERDILLAAETLREMATGKNQRQGSEQEKQRQRSNKRKTRDDNQPQDLGEQDNPKKKETRGRRKHTVPMRQHTIQRILQACGVDDGTSVQIQKVPDQTMYDIKLEFPDGHHLEHREYTDEGCGYEGWIPLFIDYVSLKYIDLDVEKLVACFLENNSKLFDQPTPQLPKMEEDHKSFFKGKRDELVYFAIKCSGNICKDTKWYIDSSKYHQSYKPGINILQLVEDETKRLKTILGNELGFWKTFQVVFEREVAEYRHFTTSNTPKFDLMYQQEYLDQNIGHCVCIHDLLLSSYSDKEALEILNDYKSESCIGPDKMNQYPIFKDILPSKPSKLSKYDEKSKNMVSLVEIQKGQVVGFTVSEMIPDYSNISEWVHYIDLNQTLDNDELRCVEYKDHVYLIYGRFKFLQFSTTPNVQMRVMIDGKGRPFTFFEATTHIEAGEVLTCNWASITPSSLPDPSVLTDGKSTYKIGITHVDYIE
jgi:hypothetical protein